MRERPTSFPEPLSEKAIEIGKQKLQETFRLTPEELDILILHLNRRELEAATEEPIAIFRHDSQHGGASIIKKLEAALGSPNEPATARTLYVKLKAFQEHLQ